MKVLGNILEPAAAVGGEPPRGKRLAMLALMALGVVYGDIGTSPLYAVRECFHISHRLAVVQANVLGVLSLITWSLVVVISVKYLLYVMRADNRGEGGILALMALIHPGEQEEDEGGPQTKNGGGRGRRWFLVAIGLFGAALLYGDGTITPAISVLSAVEGIEIAAPSFAPYVVPVTIIILVGLFVFQRRGSAGIGIVFGPLMLGWFVIIGLLGISAIVANPGVLRAVNPAYAVAFFGVNQGTAFIVISAVFLVVTGGEALYADIGHFGTRPIRGAWFGVVLPGLLLNYFGQGALLLDDPSAVRNPFYLLAPHWARYPLIVIATAATVIASQAIISGSFSLTRQAIQLGYCPRLRTEHTSPEEIGQIYIPAVNWTLMLVTVGLVIGFQRSSNLAAAYGVAVATTMVITTVLMFVVARELWHWPLALALVVSWLFLVPDLAFFSANMTKVDRGGWFPLAIAAIIYTLMSTWYRGRELLVRRIREKAAPVEDFLAGFDPDPPQRVEGTAVFLTGEPHGVPTALGLQLKHNHVLHERVLLLTVIALPVPVVSDEHRLRVTDYGAGIYRVTARFGFMETPSVPRVLRLCAEQGLDVDIHEASFFVGRESIVPNRWRGMQLWREKLFAFMARNAQPATAYFRIPRGRLIELGMETEL